MYNVSKQVCDIFNVTLDATFRGSLCQDFHITLQYEHSLKTAYVIRPNAEFYIILEDDVIIHKGFFRQV